MLNDLIRWSLRNRLAVTLVFGLILMVGGAVTARMPIDVFPDLTAPTVTVVVEGHGMAPEEMETQVTFPIETAVNGATDVRRVRSATAVGVSVVWVEFDWGTDIRRARQTVTERLATVTGRMPEGVEAPTLAPISSIMGEVLFVSLTSDRHGPMDLRTTAKTLVKRRLLSVAGVSQVTPIGGDEKQYQVVLSPARLRAYGVGLEEVREALVEANENVSAGFVVGGGTETVVRGVGRFTTEGELSAVPVADRPGGRPVTVGDLGLVRVGPAVKRGIGAAGWRDEDWNPVLDEGVILAVQKQPAANTLALTAELDRTLAELQGSLPEGMVLNGELFRQATFIENSIRNTTAALVEGALMVLLVVVAFLASMRASLITLLAIPVSLLTAVVVLWLFGASINTMTLGGMAIAIGALVDDAIIDVENVTRRLRDRRALPEAERPGVLSTILAASIEVRSSIVFATVIILLAFAPLFLLDGMEGRLLRPLGVAFCVSLGASLVTALTLTPALASYLLPTSKSVLRAEEPRLVRGLKALYRRPLELAMGHPALVTLPAVALLVLALVGLGRMGRDFLPEFHEGALVVGLVTLPGTSLEQSDELAAVAERLILRQPEVVTTGRRTGRAEEDEHVQGVESSEIEVTLDMDAPLRLGLERRSMDELLEALRADLSGLPGVQATFGQPIGHRIDHMLSGTRANVAIKLFGDDLRELRRLAGEIEHEIEGIEGVVDLSVEQQIEVPQVRVAWRRDQLARHGLSIASVSRTLEASLRGTLVTEVLEDQSAYDVVVRVDLPEGAPAAAVGGVLVDSPQGHKVPLAILADIHDDRGPNFISRENVQRKIVVMCNVAGRDVLSVVDDARAAIAAGVDLPPGYHLQFGGQFESAVETGRRLTLFGIAAVLLVGFLLHLAFGSARDVLLVMANLPFALIGAVAGVWLSGGILTVASLIGMISVFGIAARNGILLVAHVRHLQREEGVVDFADAVRRGALERLAPVLMTALSAGLALIPLALKGEQPGTEILTPMAIVILGGLVTSTALNMLVVPALLLRLGRPVLARRPAGVPALAGEVSA